MKNCLMVLLAYLGMWVPRDASGQTDTVFWFAAPEVSQSLPYNADRPVLLHITTYTQPAQVTISQPAGGGMPQQTINIPANSTQTVDLTPWIDFIENKPANSVLNYGLKIVSDALVTVYYEVVSGGGHSYYAYANPEAFILKGKNALGTVFRVPGQDMIYNAVGYSPVPFSSFDIVATENNTSITITPSNDITGHASGIPFTITLNAGQTYSATASSQAAAGHLHGSLITADKPVAVTVKDDLLFGGAVFNGGCADLTGDQIVPVHLLGTEYIAMNGFLNGAGDHVFITATQNGTTISQNGGAPLATINAGDTYRLPVSVGGATSAYIRTSYPVYVWHISGIGCETGGGLLPQINCTGSRSVSYNRSSDKQLYMNILVQQGGQGDFLVNGNAGVLTAAQFTAVPGTGGQWLAAQISLSLSAYPQGSVISVINTSALFHLGVLEGINIAGTSYGYFSNFNPAIAHARAGSGSVCSGEDILLYADTAGTGAIYNWYGPNGFSSNLQNTVVPNAGVSSSGVYTLTVDMQGCGSDTDQVTVIVTDLPVVDLGPDTVLCADSIVLASSGSYAGPSYLWNSGQTTPALTADQSGSYWLRVTENGCSGLDTVNVVLNTALTVDLGNDTSICDRDIPLTLASSQPPGTQYLWSTGLTTPSIDVIRTDRYWLETKLGNCQGSDTILVKVIPTPFIHIGNDSFICEGQPVNIGDIIPGAAYVWNTGSTSSSIEVTESGSYWLTADLEGCKVSDTVLITVMPLPEPDLGPDGDICPEQVIVLDASYAGGRYEWNTGDTTSSLAITAAGTYWVRVRSAYGCAGGDTVSFSHYPLPFVSLGADTTVCEEQPLLLHPFYTNSDSLRWSDGSVGSSLRVTEGGMYIVSGINKCGETRDTIEIRQVFCDIWVPNAFTPNGDGVNDMFKVLGNTGRLEGFHLRVFNRWGQLLFETVDRTKGWDGFHQGREALLGAYVYMLEYSLQGKAVLQKGNFTLLR